MRINMRFIEMLQYKAQNVGINVVLTEESYTSGTSFLDEESPIKANYNKKSLEVFLCQFMNIKQN